MSCTSQVYETFLYKEVKFYQYNIFFISFEDIEKIF